MFSAPFRGFRRLRPRPLPLPFPPRPLPLPPPWVFMLTIPSCAASGSSLSTMSMSSKSAPNAPPPGLPGPAEGPRLRLHGTTMQQLVLFLGTLHTRCCNFSPGAAQHTGCPWITLAAAQSSCIKITLQGPSLYCQCTADYCWLWSLSRLIPDADAACNCEQELSLRTQSLLAPEI